MIEKCKNIKILGSEIKIMIFQSFLRLWLSKLMTTLYKIFQKIQMAFFNFALLDVFALLEYLGNFLQIAIKLPNLTQA